MRKQIFIHVGPPKTGTSAVQKWLSANVSLLEEKGICYPSHKVDSNGVSSGNLRALYDIDKNKSLNLNHARLENLIESFLTGRHNTLLLSSEFFFNQMLELKTYIPNVKFIAYVRNPMETKESNYNQSVKRHSQVKKFDVSKNKQVPYMAKILDYTKKHGTEDLYLRLYGNEYFKNGNIVSDLLSVLGVTENVSMPTVNNSYQFEALEFKRWLNQFSLNSYQVIVDRALQGYSAGTAEYSLVSPAQYKKYSHYFSVSIERYAREIGDDNLEPLIKNMQNVVSATYFKQEISDSQFLSVCNYLQSKLKIDYYLLINDVSKQNVAHDDRLYHLFQSSLANKYRYTYSFLKLYRWFRNKLNAKNN